MSSRAIPIRSFPQLSAAKQREVVLKSQCVKHEAIALKLAKEFNMRCSKNTVNQWFATGGQLEQAYDEYVAEMAITTIKQAQLHLIQASQSAVKTLIKLMKDPNPSIRLRAASTILNKYLPDYQPAPKEDERDEIFKILNSLEQDSLAVAEHAQMLLAAEA